ncbi:MAG: hypothetical protein ACE5IR_12875 [bacterium]
MKKPKLVFATVGTSCIENCIPQYKTRTRDQAVSVTMAVNKDLHQDHDSTRMKLLNDDPSLLDRPSSIVANLEDGLLMFKKHIDKPGLRDHVRRVSAEVASLLMMSQEKSIGPFGEGDQIWLLPSDTLIGQVSAAANQLALQKHLSPAKVTCTPPIKGVRFAPEPNEERNLLNEFMTDGIDQFESIIRTRRQKFLDDGGHPGNCLLDITGGFKALIFFAPFLCTRGLISEVFYFYSEALRPARFGQEDVIARVNDPEKPLPFPLIPVPGFE